MKTVQRLEDFSPEARAAIAARKIEGNWEPRKLRKLFDELSQFDKVNDVAIAQAKKRTLIGFIGAFLSLFFSMFLAAFEITTWGFLLFPVFLAGGIVFVIQWKRLKKNDLLNDFRVSLAPALKDLEGDVPEGEKLRVRLDLRGPVDEKAGSKRDVRPRGSYYACKETPYLDPWCEVRIPLAGGGTAILELEIMWRKHDKRKKGRRGKTKFRTSWRKECTATATLFPPPGSAWDKAEWQSRAGFGKTKLVEKEDNAGMRLSRKWKYKGADEPEESPPAREIVGMFIRLAASMGPRPEVA
jgi:hypothetical protein